MLHTEERPIGRKVINEKEVSCGENRVLEAVRVKKINEVLRACRKDKTHTEIDTYIKGSGSLGDNEIFSSGD